MNGVALVLVALAALLILIIAAVLLPRTVRARTMRFHCPWARRDVTGQFLTCEGQQPIGVLSCTAFADPSVPACGRMCVGGEGAGGLTDVERKVADVLRG